jgi:hypothetical protein
MVATAAAATAAGAMAAAGAGAGAAMAAAARGLLPLLAPVVKETAAGGNSVDDATSSVLFFVWKE